MGSRFTAAKDWLKPKAHHSFAEMWLRTFLTVLPVWPLMNLFIRGPWYDGFGSALGFSLLYALGYYNAFHVSR